MEQSRIELIAHSEQDLDKIAQEIIQFAGNDKIWLFEGEMGAGKTTLIKRICAALGVEDIVNSPTFAIVNEYENDQHDIIFHFDFYRLEDEIEALDIGYEEYVHSGYICMMEWPSKIYNLIPDDHIVIEIIAEEDDSRKIRLQRKTY